jgi:adenosylcobinamide-GDP ribazoletransferase
LPVALGVALRDRTGFVGAVQFLTRVPVTRATAADTADVVIWFPVVGALIGAVAGGTVAGLSHLVPGSVAAAVGVLVGILVTGAFHEDGLADTADAIAGGATRERRFEILKDPRHGTYGVAALCGSVVVRVVAVASLGPAAAFAGLVAAHTLGRGAAVATVGVVPVARPDGLGADYARSVRHRAGRAARARRGGDHRAGDGVVGRPARPSPPSSARSAWRSSPGARSAASPATSSAPSSRSPRRWCSSS